MFLLNRQQLTYIRTISFRIQLHQIYPQMDLATLRHAMTTCISTAIKSPVSDGIVFKHVLNLLRVIKRRFVVGLSQLLSREDLLVTTLEHCAKSPEFSAQIVQILFDCSGQALSGGCIEKIARHLDRIRRDSVVSHLEFSSSWIKSFSFIKGPVTLPNPIEIGNLISLVENSNQHLGECALTSFSWFEHFPHGHSTKPSQEFFVIPWFVNRIFSSTNCLWLHLTIS